MRIYVFDGISNHHRIIWGRISKPTNTRSVFDRSPIIFVKGEGR